MSDDPADQPPDILTGQLSRDQRYLHLLMAAARELYTAIDAEGRMRLALDHAIDLTSADRGILFQSKRGSLVPSVARDARGRDLPLDVPHTRTAVREAWSTGELYRRTSDGADEPDASSSVQALQLQSVMAVRLDYEGHPLGVLYVDAHLARDPGAEFTEQEGRVLQTLAGLVAAALENTRLERESAHKARIEGALQFAGEMQAALLPHEFPTPPGFDMACAWRPCAALSCDYYDVVPRPDGCVVLGIGDVTGHSVRHVHHMFTTRALVRSRAADLVGPATLLSYLNTFLRADMRAAGGVFMSLFLAVLDPQDRTLTYASAGHNPPLLHHADGRLEELDATGPALGIVAHTPYTLSDPHPLAAGDALVLYTDGIFEQMDEGRQLYGEERFRESLARRAPGAASAQAIVDGLLEDLDAFRGAKPQSDDVTALVVLVS
jgi:sigma-B regulation protein RsbU (phosphoserine phosphatase)